MPKSTLALIAFVAGCGAAVVAPLVIPPAHAQTTQRWETFCAHVPTAPGRDHMASVSSAGNDAGREGWEPFALEAGGTMICFKRPAP